MRHVVDGVTVQTQSTEKTLRRLHRLVGLALEKQGEEHDKIVDAIGKVLLECFDETYDAIGQNAVLLTGFVQLGIRLRLRKLAVDNVVNTR